MSKHTPGPWFINNYNAQIDADAFGNKPVCQLLWPTAIRSENETLANARLIAAAPELLEVLKECRKMYGGFAGSAHYPDEARLIDKIDAVIKKAEGER